METVQNKKQQQRYASKKQVPDENNKLHARDKIKAKQQQKIPWKLQC